MKPRPVQAPRLLAGLARAFAPTDAPSRVGVELARGMAIQLAYRWPLGQIESNRDGDAVLLWSSSNLYCRWRRQMCAIALAVVTGVFLFLLSNALLLVPLSLGLRALGAGPVLRSDVRLGMITLRLTVTLCRACSAYRHDRRLAAHLPRASGARIRIDYLASFRQGRGCGGQLLHDFLASTDEQGIEVVLHCDRNNMNFYRGHGFYTLPGGTDHGQLTLLRPARAHTVATPVVPLQRNGLAHALESPLCVAALSSSRTSFLGAEGQHRHRPLIADVHGPACRMGPVAPRQPFDETSARHGAQMR